MDDRETYLHYQNVLQDKKLGEHRIEASRCPIHTEGADVITRIDAETYKLFDEVLMPKLVSHFKQESLRERILTKAMASSLTLLDDTYQSIVYKELEGMIVDFCIQNKGLFPLFHKMVVEYESGLNGLFLLCIESGIDRESLKKRRFGRIYSSSSTDEVQCLAAGNDMQGKLAPKIYIQIKRATESLIAAGRLSPTIEHKKQYVNLTGGWGDFILETEQFKMKMREIKKYIMTSLAIES